MVRLLVDLLVDSAPLEAGCETRLLWLETKISDEIGQQICSCVRRSIEFIYQYVCALHVVHFSFDSYVLAVFQSIHLHTLNFYLCSVFMDDMCNGVKRKSIE